MTPAQQQTINDLRDEGYLVIIWTPEELGDIDPGHLEDSLIERGNDMIETLRQDIATDDTRSYGPQGETAWGATGPTPLIAAMRCYVVGKLGDAVEVPEELA